MPEHELKIGDKAPSFSLKDETGKLVRLADFKDKQAVVLFFYPGDMTPGCTMQLCSIRDNWQKYSGLGLAVFGVNHASAVSHLAFRDKHSFPFPLLIDTNKKVSQSYDATRSILKALVIKRSVVGIDKRGIVRYLKRGMPRDQEILKVMKAWV